MTDNVNILFEIISNEQTQIDEFNRMLKQLDERKRKRCTIRPTDSGNQIRKKCKIARVWGIHYAPVWDRYTAQQPSNDSGADAGDGAASDAGAGGLSEYEGSGLVYPNSVDVDPRALADNKQLRPIIYTFPDVEYEWGEAIRYPELKKLGKVEWRLAVQNGDIVPWSALEDVQNFDPDLRNLDTGKIRNVAGQIKAGTVELPIIGVRPDGEYELIGGNTRIAMLLRLGYDPQVMLIDIPAAQKRPPAPKKKRTAPKKKAKPRTRVRKEKPKSSTERVRRYYKRHPEKVRRYLKKTQDDRVTRNRDRRKAIQKHGKGKMKNHDVHHPNGVNGGKWKLAKKDHGRDKVNETEYLYLHELMHDGAPTGTWSLITEGGVLGHTIHPYDDNKLKFKDVKKIIIQGLVGDIGAQEPSTEKLGGQNIMFTVKDGQVYFARSKSHVKHSGKNALDIAGIRQMYAGSGNMEKAFTGVMEDLQSAITKMTDEQRVDVFQQGKQFMEAELIFSDSKNPIPYEKSVLVFHGTVEYDDEGNEISRSLENGRILSVQLTDVNAEQQKTFGIRGPRIIGLNDAETADNKATLQQMGVHLGQLQHLYGLDDTSTLADYKIQWWKDKLKELMQEDSVELLPPELEGIIQRWALGNKKFKVSDITSPTTRKWFRRFEATQLQQHRTLVSRPLERIFLQVGVLALKRITNVLSSNNPKWTVQLKREILDAIQKIQDADDQDKLAELQIQVEQLRDKGIDNLVPSEGLIFMYKGSPHKFTGAFTPITQLFDLLRFKKGKAKRINTPKQTLQEAPPEQSEPVQQDAEEPPQGTAETDVETEAEPQGPPNIVVVLTGRYQPFHKGHFTIYEDLADKFGKENVYIATSNKTDAITSPFGFSDKKEIITKMFRVPEDNIVQVKSPYMPKELLDKLHPNTIYITAVSQLDSEQLDKNYFEPFEDTPQENLKTLETQGYFIVSPAVQLDIDGTNISGTQFRSLMGNPQITERAKKEIFTKAYGKFDKKIFNKIVKIATDAEEARELTQMHSAPPAQQAPPPQQPPPDAEQMPQAPAAEPPITPTDAAARQLASPEQAPEFEPYDPGETWQTKGGLFGAKNRSGITRYYTSIRSAQRHSIT